MWMDGGRVDVNVPLLEKGEKILVPLLKYEHKQKHFHIADAEISYITQVNEKMKMVYTASRDKTDSDRLIIKEELKYRHFFYVQEYIQI